MEVGTLRIGIGFLFLLPVMYQHLKKESLKDWLNMSAVGFVGNGIPAFLYPIAQTKIPSFMAGTLNSLSSLFALVIGWLFFGTGLLKGHVWGIIVGLVGAIMLAMTRSGAPMTEQEDNRFTIFVILATLCYGTSVNIIKNKLQHVSPTTVMCGAFSAIGIPCLVYLLWDGQVIHKVTTHPEGWLALGYVAFLAIVGTVLANILFVRLVQRTNAVFAATVTYLMTVFSLAWGVYFGEQPVLWHFVGLALILSGIWVVGRAKQAH